MDKEKLQKALTEYDRINGAALTECDRIYDTARDEYNRICKAARDEYSRICKAAQDQYAAWAEHVKICNAARAEYIKIRGAALAERDKAYDATWQNIAEAADDPLVSWIIKECKKYRPEALEILRMLPVSLSELDKYASHAGWCREWTGFRTKALEAGVITES